MLTWRDCYRECTVMVLVKWKILLRSRRKRKNEKRGRESKFSRAGKGQEITATEKETNNEVLACLLFVLLPVVLKKQKWEKVGEFWRKLTRKTQTNESEIINNKVSCSFIKPLKRNFCLGKDGGEVFFFKGKKESLNTRMCIEVFADQILRIR